MEKELKSVNTPEGDVKIVNGFTLKAENRKICMAILEDESIIIDIVRYEESEEQPFTNEITNQYMRLSKITTALLIDCLLKANVDFGIDAHSIIEELNKKNQE